MTRHIITPIERGHRKPLATDEPSAVYAIVLRRSTKQRLLKIRTERVRRLLDEFTAAENGAAK